MTKWSLMRRWVTSQFQNLSGKHVAIGFAGYALASWILLRLAGEQALTSSLHDFFYYLIVTASTVGYGDLSPSTDAGKWIVSLFVIPVGLTLFAVCISRVAAVTIDFWRKGLLGKRSIDVSGHILILGWNEKRTLHLIDMLLHEEKDKRPIVLCVRVDIENPMPKQIDFVRTTSFTEETAMNRAGVADASCIIIDNPEDDITFAAALFCASKNPSAHILAYFQEEVLSDLLKTHCPNAECIPSVSVEMLAKSAVDPGSSELHHELLNSQKGMTQYAVNYPSDARPTTVGDLFLWMKQDHEATLIGFRRGRDSHVRLNPTLSQQILPDDLLFYIADERVPEFNWRK